MQQVGGALEQAGNTEANFALQQQALHNETSVNDSYSNHFTPAVRDLYNQYSQFQGKDALAQYPVFQEKIKELQSETRTSLQNPMQQRMFDNISRQHIDRVLDGMSRYADQQNKVWQDQTSDSMVKSFQTTAADNWNDPQLFQGMVNSVAEEREAHAMVTGKSIEYARMKTNEDVSQMWISRLGRIANSDPVDAYDKFLRGEDWQGKDGSTHHVNIQEQIDPAHRAALEAHLLSGAKQVFARNIGRDVVYGNKQPTDVNDLSPATQDKPPLTGVVESLESGGKRYDKEGNLLTSPKGAQGEMQVMPATAKNPGYGVTPVKDDSPEELARVGRDYLGAMTARYQDPALVLAAYNAGPGKVDEWIKKYGDPRTGQITASDWASKIPFEETAKYVANGLSKVDSKTAGRGVSISRPKAQLSDMIEQAGKTADDYFPNDPIFRDSVISQVKGYLNTLSIAQEEKQKQAHSVLMASAIGAGGQKPLTLDELLLTPEAKQAWSISTPEAQKGMLALLEHNAREAQGTPIRSSATVVDDLFKRIHLPADDPNKIRNIGQLSPYFAKGINRADYEWLGKEIENQQTPEGQRLSDTRNSFFSGVKGQFDKSTMIKLDEKGGEDFYKFKQYVTDKERQYKNEGKDPYPLYNTSSPEYVGKQIPSFQRTMEQQLQDMSKALSRKQTLPPEQQRKSGESIEKYLARTKSK